MRTRFEYLPLWAQILYGLAGLTVGLAIYFGVWAFYSQIFFWICGQ